MLNRKYLIIISAFLAGLVFGLGLILSGMVNPKKVLGFLNVFGEWDPSLAFVMLGALIISSLSFILIKNNKKSLLHEVIQLPDRELVDRQLVFGSIAFGVGWGISGICPGPAVLLVGMLNDKGFVFFIAMILGFFIYQLLTDNR